MKINTLVATMHKTDYALVDTMGLIDNCIVINQTDNVQSKSFKTDSAEVQWINSTDRGLSKSRNLGLKKSDADICLLADDDLVYLEKYTQIIREQFLKNPDYDIITFQVKGIEREFKKYHPRKRELNFFTSMKVSSVEVAIKMDKFRKNNIQFDTLLGAGSKYTMGEENAVLFECIKKGLKVLYVPIKIADLHLGESTWFEGFNEKYFISRGAAFTAMTKRLNWLLILQFAVRKYKIYRKDMGFLKAIKYMFKGKNEYLKDIEYQNSKQIYLNTPFLFKLFKDNLVVLLILSIIGAGIACLFNLSSLLTFWGIISIGLGAGAGILCGMFYLVFVKK